MHRSCLSRPACVVTLPLVALATSLAFPSPDASVTAHPRSDVAPAGHASYTETIPGSKVRFRMVAVPGGTFRMGSPGTERARGADEGPAHLVSVGPLWVGQTEVTWDEYDLFRKDGGAFPSDRDNEAALAKDADAITRPTAPYPDEYRGFGKHSYPAVGMSHHAAMEYCRWLSKKTGRAYRLPTEAEWEYACRAGTTTTYFFGDDPARLGDYAWFEKNSEEQTRPVGGLRPNPWGLYDMAGNVAEWCLDHYDRDFYRASPPSRLLLGPVKLPTGDRYPHVARGGSWADPADRCRSASRRGSDKTWNRIDPAQPQSIWWVWDADFVGFRVVRAVEEQPNLRGIRSKVTKQSK